VDYIYRAGKSALYKSRAETTTDFAAPRFRASAGGEYVLARKTWIERAAKRFYSAKI
jgi:hypothetical protein